MRKKIFILFYMILVLTLEASFQVAPQIQKINLERPSTHKIFLQNNSDKLKKIKIYSERPEDQKDKNLYMGDWIIVYPKIVYLKPKGKKVIRISARPPKGLANGEYRSNLIFEEVPVKKYENQSGSDNTIKTNVNILFIISSTIYGYVGELKYQGESSNYKIITDGKKTYLSTKIKNTGTTALEGVYKISYFKNQKKLKDEEITLGKVMRNNENQVIKLLKNIPKDATHMKIEFFYKLTHSRQEIEKGKDEFELIKLEEKSIPIETITKEEYLNSLKQKTTK